MSYVVMPKEDYKNTCDTIREKTSDTEPIKSGELAEKVDKVYDAGQKALWDIVTQNNTRESWSYLSTGWHCEYLRPPYKICPTSGTIAQMFSENHALKKVESEYFDFSGYTPTQTTGTSAWYGTFRASINLEEIEDLGMKAGGYYQTFSSCSSLKKIAVVRSQAETAWNGAFSSCKALEEIRIKNNDDEVGTIGQNGFNVSACTKLSKASMLSILNACNKANAGVTITLPKLCPDLNAEIGVDSTKELGDVLVNGYDSELSEAWTVAFHNNYTIAYA